MIGEKTSHKNQHSSVARKALVYSTSGAAAIAGLAELNNVSFVLLRCVAKLPDPQAFLIAMIASGALGLIFQLPSETKMFASHSVFSHHHHKKPAETPKCFLGLKVGETLVDGLAALTDAGLSFYAIAELLNQFQVPSVAKYILGSFFALPRAISVFGLNHAHSLSHVFQKKDGYEEIKEEKDCSMALKLLGYQLLWFGLPSIVAAVGHGFETFYESEATIMNFTNSTIDAQVCSSQLLAFGNIGQALAFAAVGLLALAVAFKTGVVEGVHIKKAHEKHGGFLNWLKKTFANILLGLGNLIASMLHTLPAAATVAILPLDHMAKIFIISSIVLLDGFVGTFVHGKYWQEAMKDIKKLLLAFGEKISCCTRKDQVEADLITAPTPV
ncbi:MAG: hypothetical protein K0S08_1498 [Gammaproteobacteria bacterium]|jgi:hypothetical protein|nr:hypothetical protein [Gammaproteobacteria bacterium]